jgi:hypothetical protein
LPHRRGILGPGSPGEIQSPYASPRRKLAMLQASRTGLRRFDPRLPPRATVETALPQFPDQGKAAAGLATVDLPTLPKKGAEIWFKFHTTREEKLTGFLWASWALWAKP